MLMPHCSFIVYKKLHSEKVHIFPGAVNIYHFRTLH